MTFSKGFLIAAFLLVVFGLSNPVTAAETKPAAHAKAEVKAVTKTDVMPSHTTPAPVAPAAVAATPATAAPAANAVNAAQPTVVDIKNLPKNLTSLIPNDGDVFILSVGETKLITAARQRKCFEKEPPKFEDTKLRLPPNDLITFSTDNKVYERFSRRCVGIVPAIAIMATGVKKGTQKMLILGANLDVMVK